MKAIRRLFKRNKNRQQPQDPPAPQQQPPQQIPAIGEAVPSRPIIKSTPQLDPPSPEVASGQSSSTLTARSDSLATRAASNRTSLGLEPPSLPTEKQTPKRAVSQPTKDEEPTERTTKAPSQKSGPSTTGLSKRPITDQEKGTYKGVSESFKKGMTVTQRFGVGEPPEDRSSTDLNMLGKLGDAYDSIPLLEQTKLPRGGISMETKAVGRIQYGIPPETIKDSMTLGIPVPQVYIVPAERFCREMGPALGVNLAEFEFPAYFNFFVYKKRCTLVVDSQEAEENICRVFNETLLGPAQFRRDVDPVPFEDEDFAPDFPRDAIPNLEKELRYFRIMPDGKELAVDVLLDFSQFKQPGNGYCHENLGVPPNIDTKHFDDDDDDEIDEEELEEALGFAEDEEAEEEEQLPSDAQGVEKRADSKWSYKKARWVGDVATVWPPNATEDQKRDRTVPRVEIFKMPSGTEYIIHDIDVNNVIIGKARFSGHVKVSETMGVEGFGGQSFMENVKAKPTDGDDGRNEDNEGSYNALDLAASIMSPSTPPTFHPPSFGLTTLGNSHGFDKSGSVSGYVLWVNGRGIMIDPPPYSSATLEREGIRPRTIVGIILTHCHADHDAGAFQKVLTGSPVVVITTPTIYKSFIRKYAALASLSPSLLRHSHRYKPAIIGEPLRFQGATFHFTYSLHVIPCVAFRVEWRGRSMVFTGDHMNKPDEIDRLQSEGILSKARADDLRNLPLQETDLLLHEAGAPPIHTPLEVLMQLPPRVKKRLYVVHTSTIPENCDLRVAPTGTAGTLRLDQINRSAILSSTIATSTRMDRSSRKPRSSRDAYSISLDDDEVTSQWSSPSNEYAPISEDGSSPEALAMMNGSFAHAHVTGSFGNNGHSASHSSNTVSSVPLVSLRPASSTDAWFILNLLSAVPFLSSLSYASTMEVLETARVDSYCKNDVVVPASRRSQFLCVVWEGTCVERNRSATTKGNHLLTIKENGGDEMVGAVWHAGDWTGPIALQPDKRLSGESELSATHDIVAMANEGVKVITIDFASLHQILRTGSPLYGKYLDRRQQQLQRRSSYEASSQASTGSTPTQKLLGEAMKNLNVIELLDQNSALRKLSAVQKRHLESLAEGPIAFGPGERLWRAGAPVDKAFLMVGGTASFLPRRRNAGSATASGPSSNLSLTPNSRMMRLGDSTKGLKTIQDPSNVGEEMQNDVLKAVEEMGDSADSVSEDESNPGEMVQLESLFSRYGDGQSKSLTEAHDFAKLSKNLQKRAEILTRDPTCDASVGSSQDSASGDSDHFSEEFSPAGLGSGNRRASRRRSSRARFANKVLGRLYSRRAFTGGLVFSRGHFLGDVSKMVAGLLSSDYEHEQDGSCPVYGFGDKVEGSKEPLSDNLTDMVIHEQEGDSHVVHSSTLTAGNNGCVVLIFPKESLIPFLDDYPGLLLSLLGTQVVV